MFLKKDLTPEGMIILYGSGGERQKFYPPDAMEALRILDEKGKPIWNRIDPKVVAEAKAAAASSKPNEKKPA